MMMNNGLSVWEFVITHSRRGVYICVRMSLVYCWNTLCFLLLLLYVYPTASRWRIITYRISSVHQPHFSGSSAKSHHLEYVIFKTQQCEEKSRHIWSPKLWLPNLAFKFEGLFFFSRHLVTNSPCTCRNKSRQMWYSSVILRFCVFWLH